MRYPSLRWLTTSNLYYSYLYSLYESYIRRCVLKVFAGPYWAVLWAVAALRLVG